MRACRRIRIAYTSSDIKKQHPVAHLVLSLFHLHDMLTFQVIYHGLFVPWLGFQ